MASPVKRPDGLTTAVDESPADDSKPMQIPHILPAKSKLLSMNDIKLRWKQENLSKPPARKIDDQYFQPHMIRNDGDEMPEFDDNDWRDWTLIGRRKTVKEVRLEDFVKIKQLGRGSFGKVIMARMKGDSEKKVYAIKQIRKD